MIKETITRFKKRLWERFYAYNKVFDRKSPYVEVVLKDLSRFCRAHNSTFHKDPRAHAMLEGRREVWLRIQEYLRMTPEEIYDLHVIKEINPDKGES